MTNEKITHIDLFSGIGGFALAADRVFGNVEHIFCDIEPFSQAVLKKHWPKAKIYGDIRTLTYAEHKRLEGHSQYSPAEYWKNKGVQSRSEIGISILTGGFPCQPFSQAGRRRGTADDRYLWPEMLRVIREFHPRWVIGENVGGLVTWNEGMVLEQVHIDLEGEGYEVQAFIIPACAVNAPHRRDRVWIVAHSKHPERIGRRGRDNGDAARMQRAVQIERCDSALHKAITNCPSINEERWDSGQGQAQFRRSDWEQNWLEVATRLCRVDDGVPRRLDRNPRLKALGNAIVPQVAEEIMRAIKSIT